MEFGFLKNKKAEKKSNSRKQKKRRKEKTEITEESKSQLHIPQEIVDNILTRLPLKSLVRFESVCKAWCSSISNPNFQRRDRHSVLSISKSSKARLYHSIREQQAPFVESCPVFWDYSTRTDNCLHNREDQYSRVHVSNSCNGMVLVCVGISFYLFNPSTNYSVKVLTLNYLDARNSFDTFISSGDDSCYNLCIALYYDETICDYKAVVLIRHPLLRRRKPQIAILVEASLKGKRWNHLNHTFRASDDIIMGPMVKGRIHWLVNKKLTRFDPVLKVFEELPSFQPTPNHRKYSLLAGIGILEGCLCVSRIVNENSVEILAMKEYGVSESWTPIFSFSDKRIYYYHDFNPLLLTRAGELLISTKNNIWVYNLGKKSLYRLLIKGLPTCSISFVQNTDTPTGYYWNQTEHENFGNTGFSKSRDVLERNSFDQV